MAMPQEKLAESLEVLRELQDRGVVAIRAADLSRAAPGTPAQERLPARGHEGLVHSGAPG